MTPEELEAIGEGFAITFDPETMNTDNPEIFLVMCGEIMTPEAFSEFLANITESTAILLGMVADAEGISPKEVADKVRAKMMGTVGTVH